MGCGEATHFNARTLLLQFRAIVDQHRGRSTAIVVSDCIVFFYLAVFCLSTMHVVYANINTNICIHTQHVHMSWLVFILTYILG